MEKSQALPMQENNSINFEDQAAKRFVVKRDGKQEVYDSQVLWNYLKKCVSGLNEAHFNLDMIVDKVTKGLYNGKSPLSLACSPSPKGVLPPSSPSKLMGALIGGKNFGIIFLLTIC